MSTWNLDLSNENNFIQSDSSKTDINGSIVLQPSTYDNYTKLLCKFDDVGPKSITRGGSAIIKTAQSKFGSSSAYFNGTTDYIQPSNSYDFNFGSGDFTIDCWAYSLSQAAQYVPIFSMWGGNVSGLPSGMTFDPATRKIRGVATTAGQHAVTLTANDGKGGVTNQGFLLTLTPVPTGTKIEDCFE